MVDLRIRLAPHHSRQLSRMFTRMKTEAREQALSVTRGELRGIIRPTGEVTERALPPLGGDVTGAFGANVLTRLRGRPVAATAPVTGQALGWTGTSWAPISVVTNTHWEPIANGDPADPQILFGADGDVLMTEVPN